MKPSIYNPIRCLMLVLALWPSAFAAGKPRCQSVGGSVMTNFGGVDQNTTLGTATGDLRGAVAGTVVNVVPGANGTSFSPFSITGLWRRVTASVPTQPKRPLCP